MEKMTGKHLVFEQYTSTDNLAEKLATHISRLLAEAISQHGQSSLVVSGGTTPVALFRRLSGINIAWQHVHITLADERWVDTNTPTSNEHLVRIHLLRKKAAKAHFVGLKTAAPTAHQGVKECTGRIARMSMPFDVVVLGMGNDGHTASFFPGSSDLPDALNLKSGKLCTALTPPDVMPSRMTLTLPTLLNSHKIFLHIESEEKRRIYEKALQDGPPEKMPIRFFLRQQAVPVTVCWAP